MSHKTETWDRRNRGDLAPWSGRRDHIMLSLPNFVMLTIGGVTFDNNKDPINLNDVWRSTTSGCEFHHAHLYWTH